MADNDRKPQWMDISCKPLDWQLSAVVQVLNSFLSSLPSLENLEIAVSRKDPQNEIDVTQWPELFHLFASVKEMTLASEGLV